MLHEREYYSTYTVAVGKNAVNGADGFYELAMLK